MSARGILWHDRRGGAHRERSTRVPVEDPPIPRVQGPIESAWIEAGRRVKAEARRERRALGTVVLRRANPLITDDHAGSGTNRIFTWVTAAPNAVRVLLWVNGLFNHTRVADSEMTRLEGSDLWTISLRLPATWRGSFCIAVWEGPGEAPWRLTEDRMDVRRAALDLGRPDPRAVEVLHGSGAEAFSVATGPEAPELPWPPVLGPTGTVGPAGSTPRVDLVDLGACGTHAQDHERAWVYRPEQNLCGAPTPLLILFDGQVWNEQLRLPHLIDAMIRTGRLAPLHVAMLDSHETATRWSGLGVPSGQVDVVLDRLLPRLRQWPGIDRTPETTVVSGQSLGGLSALWAVALAEGTIGHAIAQSPSLWRFDMAPVMAAEEHWSSVLIQSGTREGDMLTDARTLADAVRPALARPDCFRVEAVEGGHDWAWWRVHLLRALVNLFPGPDHPRGTRSTH